MHPHVQADSDQHLKSGHEQGMVVDKQVRTRGDGKRK